MRTNELLAVADREIELLTADNWHAAAAVLREMTERLRACAARLRENGLSAESDEHK